MKKLLILMFAVGLTFGAYAQPKIGGSYRGGSIRGGTVYTPRPRVTIIAPYAAYGPAYRFYGNRFGYSPFYDPFYGSMYGQQRLQSSPPSQLDIAIDDIKEDFDYQMDTVKDDKSLTKDERKQKIRDLKHQREDAISEAKKNYYRDKRSNEDRS